CAGAGRGADLASLHGRARLVSRGGRGAAEEAGRRRIVAVGRVGQRAGQHLLRAALPAPCDAARVGDRRRPLIPEPAQVADSGIAARIGSAVQYGVVATIALLKAKPCGPVGSTTKAWR